ncbi:FecR family protein [Runella slithyformis]|uniref:Anti-FecI sigma factor, FecR n=1 Tax=Runella slithyformis (strain ATCC 29530 / DSM 19594 / LMG 11500 / NCIMB 11436 / LSU 4) TaxID=761193 RepID=A0A7U3ZPY7_RUNSL|nr:FecR family protein [Runella slithyformis]AEI51227.1 anti-FecI sigma factor, FecR [Runella slithyformis DSM 19594]
MTQQEFNDLSKRYLEGKTTEKEDNQLMDWFNTQPKQLPLPPFQSQKKEIEKRIWQNIQARIRPASNGLTIKMAWLVGIAACFVCGFSWLSTHKLPQDNNTTVLKNPEQVGIEMKNTTMIEQKVRLEDGTEIMLKQNSSIIYDKNYNKTKREVHLIGEAFFIVKRNVTKPFVVHTGDLTTEVLGTSFRIKHHQKANTIEVAVTTGKVSVYAEKSTRKSERNGVILTPNQRVVFDVVSKNMVPGIVEIPIPIAINEESPPQLIFKEASLEHVLEELSKLYGIEFMIANPNAKDCHITADLNGLSLFTQLELICKSIDATYEKRGTVVFIYGEGC